MTSPFIASLTETQNGAAFSRPKIIVVNVVALRGLQPETRTELLSLLNDAAINGARPVLSIREHDQAMEEMIAITLPCMIPDSSARDRLVHGGKLMFSHAELAEGANGIMGQDKADLYLSIDTYKGGVASDVYIDLSGEDALLQVSQALKGTPAQLAASGAAPGPVSAPL